MFCLTNMCYVCLEKRDKSLVNINNSLLVNEDIIHIIGYVPLHLDWMKTKQIILICEECCRRLRETYQFLIMCHRNSAMVQSYMDEINTANISDADNDVNLDNKQDEISKIKLEDDEVYTFVSGPIIEEPEDVFVNVDDAFVKEEDTWKMAAEDEEDEPPMENNSTERSDNGMDTEIAVNSDTHDTDTVSDSSGFTSTQGHTTNETALNAPAKQSHKCLTCSKSFSSSFLLQVHTRMHKGQKPYKCTGCKKSFDHLSSLVAHTRTHGPHICVTCNKSFDTNSSLQVHTRVHTGEKPYKCTTCEKCFCQKGSLVSHLRTHTGEMPYKCAKCEKCFGQKGSLKAHLQRHTCGKRFKCATCEKRFRCPQNLRLHEQIHTHETPICSRCNRPFKYESLLLLHTHTCAVCCEGFCSKEKLKSHMLVAHAGE